MQTIENFVEAAVIWEKSNSLRQNASKSDSNHFIDLMNRIEQFSTLKPNWDTYGAEQTNELVIEIARKLLIDLYSKNLIDPVFTVNVFPIRDGGIQFEIDADEDSCEVEISPKEILTLITYDLEGNIKSKLNFNQEQIAEIGKIFSSYAQ
jgi:hypothetical protein